MKIQVLTSSPERIVPYAKFASWTNEPVEFGGLDVDALTSALHAAPMIPSYIITIETNDPETVVNVCKTWHDCQVSFTL